MPSLQDSMFCVKLPRPPLRCDLGYNIPPLRGSGQRKRPERSGMLQPRPSLRCDLSYNIPLLRGSGQRKRPERSKCYSPGRSEAEAWVI